MATYDPKYLEFDHVDTPNPADRFTLRLFTEDNVQVQGNTIFLSDTPTITQTGTHYRVTLTNACFSPESPAAYNVPVDTLLHFTVTAADAAGNNSSATPQDQPFKFTDSMEPVTNVHTGN